MHHLIAPLLFGAVAGGGAKQLKWRQMLKAVIKSGIVATRRAEALGAELRSEFNQMVAETRAELDQHPTQASPQDV